MIAMITRISEASGIEVDTRAEEAEQLAQVWRGLNGRGLACLVILDNFPENVNLRPYRATTGRVHTIVTTRRQDLGGATVRLPFLTMEESTGLLNSGERQLGQEAEALAEEAGWPAAGPRACEELSELPQGFWCPSADR